MLTHEAPLIVENVVAPRVEVASVPFETTDQDTFVVWKGNQGRTVPLCFEGMGFPWFDSEFENVRSWIRD